jgi:hypothetical protein
MRRSMDNNVHVDIRPTCTTVYPNCDRVDDYLSASATDALTAQPEDNRVFYRQVVYSHTIYCIL